MSGNGELHGIALGPNPPKQLVKENPAQDQEKMCAVALSGYKKMRTNMGHLVRGTYQETTRGMRTKK